jgi:hypothetical protein
VEKWAECHLTLAPGLLPKATRAVEAAAKLTLYAEAPISRAALGEDIKLVIKGQHASELFLLLQAMNEPGADVLAILAELRELGGVGANEGSGAVADDGEDGGGAA